MFLWGTLGLEDEEGPLFRQHGIRHRQCQGENLSYSFAFIVAKASPKSDHLSSLTVDGDIMVAEDNIYFRKSQQWKIARISKEKASKHPFLRSRKIFLHPGGFIVSWASENTISSLSRFWTVSYHCDFAKNLLAQEPIAGQLSASYRQSIEDVFNNPWRTIPNLTATRLLTSSLHLLFPQHVSSSQVSSKRTLSPSLSSTATASNVRMIKKAKIGGDHILQENRDTQRTRSEPQNPQEVLPSSSLLSSPCTIVVSFPEEIIPGAIRVADDTQAIITRLYGAWGSQKIQENSCVEARWEGERNLLLRFLHPVPEEFCSWLNNKWSNDAFPPEAEEGRFNKPFYVDYPIDLKQYDFQGYPVPIAQIRPERSSQEESGGTSYQQNSHEPAKADPGDTVVPGKEPTDPFYRNDDSRDVPGTSTRTVKYWNGAEYRLPPRHLIPGFNTDVSIFALHWLSVTTRF